MVQERGWVSLRSRPVVRRLVLVLFLAGMGAILYLVLLSSPVSADLTLNLAGDWPPVNSVTLVYSRGKGDEALREVRWFPDGPRESMNDTPRLSPGSYHVVVTVLTDSGSRRFARSVQHARGGRSRIDLRF
jgi:hypothetical protein